MRASRIGAGVAIAGIGGLALFVSLFLPWYGTDALDGVDVGVTGDLDAWESFALLDVVLLLVAVVAVGLTLVALAESTPELPRPPGRITMGVGALALVAILMRLVFPPEADLGLGIEADLQPRIGSFAGLVAAAAIAYGGWRATEEPEDDGPGG